MTDTVIKVENLSKQYRLGVVGTGTISHDLNRWWHKVRGKEDPYLQIGETNDRAVKGKSKYVWALKDINFEVRQGEVLGIIGKNGAGKSTLLKLLSRVTSPTTGEIKAKGRVASLLEVGTGFHPELTGRENIFLNGAILGMAKAEIKSKLDEIVEFSGTARYVDTPVKRYSSGMRVRLAFAVAAHLEPEILIVDEVLAVGDAEFQKKAIGKMQEVSKGEGRTILFVSHQLNSISTLCTDCLLIQNGKISERGSPKDIISSYISDENENSSIWVNSGQQHQNSYFKPVKLTMVNEVFNKQSVFENRQKIGFQFEGDVEELNPSVVVGFAIYNSDGFLIFWSLNTDKPINQWLALEKGRNKFFAWIPPHLLNEGNYRIHLIAAIHYRQWICKPEISSPTVSFSIKGGLSESPNWQEARPGLLAPIIDYIKI